MNYGLYLPNFGAFGDPLTLVALARDAEAAGWDGFFIWDHIAGYQNDIRRARPPRPDAGP